jgi:hypothetical protein
MLTTFINTLMPAEAEAVSGTGYEESSPERVNTRKRLPPPRLRHPRRHPRRRDLGITKLSKSHVSELAAVLDTQIADYRSPTRARPVHVRRY